MKGNAWEAIDDDDAEDNGDEQVKSANSGWNRYRLGLHCMALALCIISD